MQDQFSRTRLLLGSSAMEKLASARVAVFGVGGVGGYVAEALARSGIGSFDLIDSDIISTSNINRQIIATVKTAGRYKVDVMKERILDINPCADVYTYKCFFLPGSEENFPFSEYSYVVDAVDTVTAKIGIILKAKEAGIPVISSMGAGNKLEASQFKVADIYKTKVCPLAKVMRRELKKRGVDSLKVVYSEELPVACIGTECQAGSNKDGIEKGPGRQVPGSVAFVPSAAGLIIAGEVVKDLIK
ncbi:MAG: tRNA threonylcarbamoyladenosine dehydratase [Lachnospiraceae bacterium]|nr:tRNA threonylcarbamoyladenosine dehydratase [Lachnospiraceae bacterium]